MPYIAKHPCSHPGCPNLVPHGMKYCKEHSSMHQGEDRPRANERGYNARWRKARKRYLTKHPLCVECLKKDPPMYREATVVDHIRPHRGDPVLFWDESNWQALCKECHDLKTGLSDSIPEYRY